MALEQWVNLGKKPKYQEGTPLYRLGLLRLRAKFKKDTLVTYKWKIVRTDGVKYTKAERKRNRRFRLFKGGARTNQNKTELRSTQDFHLPAAGGNKYRAVAICNKTEVKSREIEVRRRLWFHVMHMAGVKPLSIKKTLEDTFWKPAKKLYIESKELGGKPSKIDYQKTLWTVSDSDPNFKFQSPTWTKNKSNDAKFRKAARDAWKKVNGDAKAPYAYGLAFVNYIVDSTEATHTEEVDFDVPSRLTKWKWGGDVIEVELGELLWWDLVPEDDKVHGWFVKGRIIFIEEGGKSSARIDLDPKNVRPAGPDYGAYGGKTRVKIRLKDEDIERNFFTKKKGRWFLKMTVRTAGGWSGGFAYTYIPLIAIATRSFFDDIDEDSQLATVMHEVGHKIGLAATGDGPVPDKTADLYGHPKGKGDDRGHWGPHCANGAGWDGKKWSGTPNCVMWGANGYYDKAAKKFVKRKSTFCPNCEKIIRKLDLASQTLTIKGFRDPI